MTVGAIRICYGKCEVNLTTDVTPAEVLAATKAVCGDAWEPRRIAPADARCGTCSYYRGSRAGQRNGGWVVMQGCGQCAFPFAPAAFRQRLVTETDGCGCQTYAALPQPAP